jgi:hypothetical protein
LANVPAVPKPSLSRMQTIDAVKQAAGSGFDADVWHVIEARDSALIADEVLNGAGSSKFVYQFEIQGKPTAGISVVGARHLASAYGGIKHRILASVQKIGSLFTFTSYPQPGMPMNVHCQVIPELEDEDDFYSAIVEITDIKTGNSIQAEKRESRYEVKRNGSRYEKPHYATIAQSKAYRNGVLAIIPQDVQMTFKLKMLGLGQDEVITGSIMDEKRSGVLRFAAAKGLTVDRRAVEALTMDQIAGLSDAARVGQTDFTSSAQALGVMQGAEVAFAPPPLPTQPTPPPAQPKPAAAQQQARRPAAKQQPQDDPPPHDEAWTGHLVDEWQNEAETYPTHDAYARALASAWEKSQERAQLLEANEEWIVDVLGTPGPAADIVRDLMTRTPRQTDEADPGQTAEPAGKFSPVAVVTGRQGIIWPAYVKALKESLGKVDMLAMDEWAAANIETIRTAPDLHRLNVVKAVREHVSFVGGGVPEVIQRVIQPAAEPVDHDRKWAEGAVAEMAAETDRNKLITFQAGTIYRTKMAAFKGKRDELHDLVEDAYIARMNALGPADDDTFPGDR